MHQEVRANVVFNDKFAAGTFDYPAAIVPSFDANLFDLGYVSSQSHLYLGLIQRFHFLDGHSQALTAVPLFPGVTQLRNVVHNNLVVEQSNGVVVLEAPVYREHGQAVSAWIAQNIPNKPVTHVIQSHHHFDHAAALREVIALEPSAALVAHAAAVDFYTNSLFTAPSTVVPDALEPNPRSVAITAVPNGGMLTLADPLRPIEVWSVSSAHAADMVVAILPNEGLLFNADLEAPNGQIPTPAFMALAQELNDFLIASGVPVTTIAAAHGAGLETVAQFRAFWGF